MLSDNVQLGLKQDAGLEYNIRRRPNSAREMYIQVQ